MHASANERMHVFCFSVYAYFGLWEVFFLIK